MRNSSLTAAVSAAWALMACLALLNAGCGEEHGDPVISFDDNDPEMNAAILQARRNLNQFLFHIRQHPDAESSFIKAPIATGERREHIWINHVTYDGRSFTGTLANQPYDLSKYKQGDEVTVPREDVSDWMYVLGDQVYGGYTMQVTQRRMAENSLEQSRN